MKKAKIVGLGCQKARARKAEDVHLNMTRQRTEKAERIVPARQGKVQLEKKIGSQELANVS